MQGAWCLFCGRVHLAQHGGVYDGQTDGFGGVALAQNVRSEADVDDIVSAALGAGGTVTRSRAKTFYGGYAGTSPTPAGHLWEIAYSPGFPLAADGSITVPTFDNP